MLAQVGPKIGVTVVHVNVDDMRAGKHKEWQPLMTSRSIPYTVLVDGQRKQVKAWNGAYDAGEFGDMVKEAMKK